ncbi:nitroreductase family protein [Cohnella sp. JJ-181]|uniref:nitroreductase family protein n=1 Tax=Cohnella rhizoplanae TaxID=2974897 RepID=UPI0022FF54B6|nr:nitroreductase [Cohnella sp. JJ-181]CAI6081653.1 Putative NAD(P)H nitroreductase YdjA [Cohnella sp. JJ-181]
MELLEAIKGRRSIGKVKDEPVARELIEQLIEAAVWAPSHHKTEPWRFVVMTGEGRRALGRAYAAMTEPTLGDMAEQDRADRLSREEAKALRAPVVIAAISSPAADHPRAVLWEERAAAHAAVQNLLLAAHGAGLAAVWRTGDGLGHTEMVKAFDLAHAEEIVGFIYIGYPDMTPPAANRVSGADKTRWIES